MQVGHDAPEGHSYDVGFNAPVGLAWPVGAPVGYRGSFGAPVGYAGYIFS